MGTYYSAINAPLKAIDFLKKARTMGTTPDFRLEYEILNNQFSALQEGLLPLDTLKIQARRVLKLNTSEKQRFFILFKLVSLLKDYPADQGLKRRLKSLKRMVDENSIELSDWQKNKINVLYQLYIARNIKKAVELKKSTLPENWQENPSQLNSFAWWCFEHKINLPEAAQLAQKGAELASDPDEKASILDTWAEILSLQGKHQKAIEVEQQAIDLNPQRKLFKRNLEKFKKRLENKK